MGKTICAIPADSQGNKLWIKDYKQEKKRAFVKYKSTYNDIPFQETEVFSIDGGQNLVITGGDGTVLYRFSSEWINKLLN